MFQRARRVSVSGQSTESVNLAALANDIPRGAWDTAPITALLLPIAALGQGPSGVLLVAISPAKSLDESYGTFFDLLARQIATSIADARSHEEERKRTESLAELDRTKTAFFTNISHEFRTPLTLLLAPIEETLENPNATLGEEERSHLEVAHRNGMRLLKLVNTLLDFARIEAGGIQASYEPADLCSLTTDLVSMFRSVVETAGLYLAIECAPLEDPIFVDRDMWEKVVLNLMSNAFKFTFNGGIRVRLNDQGNSVEFAITDTGCGIPESELPRLFERFHRVEGASGRTFEGSGIGLALVQEFVKLHGGKVTVESAVGRGSTFRVFIPKGKGHLPPERIQSVANQGSGVRDFKSYVAEAAKWFSRSPEKATDFPVPSRR